MGTITRIQISQQHASLDISTKNASMKIHNDIPQMTIRNNQPRMSHRLKAPSFKLDFQQVMSEIGVTTPIRSVMKAAAAGGEAAMAFTAEKVHEGDVLADVTNPGNRVAMLAKNKSMQETGPKEINVGLSPQSMPPITWDEGENEISWTKGDFRLDWTRGKFTLDAENASVNVSLRNRHSVSISAVQEQLPPFTGVLLDTKW